MPLEMNPEIRAQWCAALRSGEYQQASEALRKLPEETQSDRPAYCCLGVLTDLWLKAGHGEMVEDYIDEYAEVPVSVWADPEGLLAPPVVEWSGLGETDPLLDPERAHRGLASALNDAGLTFAEIADLIDGGAS